MIKLATLIILSTLAGELQHHPVEIIGQVISAETKEPVPFASVILLDEDGKQIAGTATDFEGGFKLTDNEPVKQKVLQVSAVGFQPCLVENLNQIYSHPDYFGLSIPLELKTQAMDDFVYDPRFVLKIPKDWPSNMPILKIPKDWPSNMPIAGIRNQYSTDSLMVKILRIIPIIPEKNK